MLQKLDGLGYQSTLLSTFRTVIHGFSDRSMGDMEHSRKNREAFSHTLGIATPPILAQQVHGNLVGLIDKALQDVVPGVDGLVSRGIPIAVVAADCVPVLLVDPLGQVCSAVHAGWKGTLGGVVGNAVQEMVRNGAHARRICAALGPHIGACCYDVPEERVKAFREQFGTDEKMAFNVDGAWHLDIGWANYRQLIKAGLSSDHIDAPPTCTSCQNNEFFSYRRDIKETYGEMMAVIGFRI